MSGELSSSRGCAQPEGIIVLPFTGVVPGVVQFNFFINGLDGGTEFTSCNFAGSTNLGEVADTPQDSQLEKQFDRNLMKFSKEMLNAPEEE